MAFFDDMKEKLSQASQTAVKKTKELSDIARLNSEISATEKQISELYRKMGSEIYRVYRENPQPEVAEMMVQVTSLLQKIEENRAQLETINVVHNCPQCGARVKDEMVFCSSCGFKLPERETVTVTATETTESSAETAENTQEPVENAEASAEPAPAEAGEGKPQFCGECGAPLAADALFCTGCGAKVD